jgi:hypothetical protein
MKTKRQAPHAMFAAVRVGYYRVLVIQGHCTHFVHNTCTGLHVFIVFFRIPSFCRLQIICPPQPRCLSWPPGPVSALPTSASPTLPMPHNIRRVEELIHSYCYVTDGLCYNLSVCKGSVIAVIEELGYSKVCDNWVPRILRYASKETGEQSQLIFCTNMTWQ